MRTRGSVAGPLVLIIIGAMFLLREFDPGFQIAELLSRWWPYFLILWGVVAAAEVCIRFLRNAPIPTNGVSGGSWLLVIAVCVVGATAYEIHRPEHSWWRGNRFMQGMVNEMGEEHQVAIDPAQRTTSAKPLIVIESFRGDAKVTASDGNEVVLSGEKSIRTFDNSSTDAANAASKVEMISQGNTVVIRAHQGSSSRFQVTSNLDLRVPKGASVEMVGTRGDLEVTGLTGDVTLTSENAGVRLQDIGGKVKVETRNSDVIRCENVKGDVDLRGRGDDVELVKVSGQVTISGDYRGSVSLRELAKPVRVSNSHTQLDVQEVPGEIRLERGSFNAENVVGPVKLATHSTDVTMNGFTAGLDLTVDRGDIEIRPNRTPLGKMQIHATSGNIELSLPEAAKFALNASTERGEIDNEFGEALKETSAGGGAKLEGSVGSGPDLDLVTTHGTITVRKAAEINAPAKVKSKEKDGEASVHQALASFNR